MLPNEWMSVERFMRPHLVVYNGICVFSHIRVVGGQLGTVGETLAHGIRNLGVCASAASMSLGDPICEMGMGILKAIIEHSCKALSTGGHVDRQSLNFIIVILL